MSTEVTANPEVTTQANFNKPAQTAEPSIGAPTQAPATNEPAVNAAPQSAPTEYTPNYRFKVMDQEHEFDEFVRGAIKDADTEKKARELYEKAYGLDHIKPRFQETKEKYKTLEQQHVQLTGQINELQEVYSRGDFDSFFKKLAIPQEKVLQWVLEKAKFQEMPQEQRQIIEGKKQAEQKAWELEKQTQQLQNYYQTQVVQAKTYALNTALDRQDMKAYAQAYDARAGRPGAFRDEVINRGELAWYTKGVDISPEQAIQEVIQFSGLAQQQMAPAPQAVVQEQAPKPAPKRPPSIPNVGGQTTSPMKPKYTSLDQLKKRYDDIRR